MSKAVCWQDAPLTNYGATPLGISKHFVTLPSLFNCSRSWLFDLVARPVALTRGPSQVQVEEPLVD